jgi:hypothetical protein
VLNSELKAFIDARCEEFQSLQASFESMLEQENVDFCGQRDSAIRQCDILQKMVDRQNTELDRIGAVANERLSISYEC